MSEPSLNTEPIPANVESVQPAAAILVSCVKNAFDTSTQHYEAKEIIDRIRSEELRVPIATIRREFSDNMASTGNDRKAVKNAIAERKKRLPGAIWSGTFGCRVQPVEDHLLQHSGLLGADLDGLGNELAEIRTKLTNSLHLWALFLSPSGDGLKCVFRVPAQAEKHFASFRAVEEHVRELCGRKIDQSCSDVSRLCFLTHDPDAYLNENAIELPPLPEAERRDERVAPSVQNDPEIGIRQSIAAELVGEIQWASDTRGFCACPAHHLHTTG